jgi:hypothetical protein
VGTTKITKQAGSAKSTRKILCENRKKWGYEGNTSMAVYGLPANRWSDEIEDKIVESARRQVKKVRNGK